MNNLFQFLACISACIATIAIVLIGADLFSSIRTEKEEKTQTDDVKKNINETPSSTIIDLVNKITKRY